MMTRAMRRCLEVGNGCLILSSVAFVCLAFAIFLGWAPWAVFGLALTGWGFALVAYLLVAGEVIVTERVRIEIRQPEEREIVREGLMQLERERARTLGGEQWRHLS